VAATQVLFKSPPWEWLDDRSADGKVGDV